MAGLQVYNGTTWVSAAPYVCKTTGTWSQPSNIYVYNGTSWVSVWPSITFSIQPGTYNATGSFTVVCSQVATWTYAISGATAYLSRSPLPGFSSTTASFSLTRNDRNQPTTATVTNLQANINGQTFGPWNINLSSG